MNYEEFVKTTDVKAGEHDLEFYLDGFREEVGEISGVLRKIRRGDYGDYVKSFVKTEGLANTIKRVDEVREDFIKEIGDSYWYITRTLQEIGVDWDLVKSININKLKKRQLKNIIVGEGSNR